jgi:exonuclease III
MDLGHELREGKPGDHGRRLERLQDGTGHVSSLEDGGTSRSRTGGVNARIAAEGFVDIWHKRQPKAGAYSWFNHRARNLDAARVDYVLISSDLVHRIRSADILDLLS